jgi:hypothetical protein
MKEDRDQNSTTACPEEIKMRLLPLFQFIGFAETGIELGAKVMTDEWLARLAKHAATADRILKDVCNVQ